MHSYFCQCHDTPTCDMLFIIVQHFSTLCIVFAINNYVDMLYGCNLIRNVIVAFCFYVREVLEVKIFGI